MVIKCIQENVSLNNYNWFGVGGNARYLAIPQSISEFQEVIQFACQHNFPVKVIGVGANILISDEGYEGIIIKLPTSGITHKYISPSEGLLKVNSGVSIEEAINYCLETAFLFGLEEFSGIPSSVGGALFINLHYFEFLIEQYVYKATIFDIEKNIIFEVDKEWFEFGYDMSKVKKNKNYIILDATFILKRGDSKDQFFAKGRSQEIIRHRVKRYPHKRTCGCFFRNFMADEIPFEIEGKKVLAAGYYLDLVEARNNLRVNYCFVSSRHANMITHDGQGTAQDIIAVAKIMQERVYKKFGLLLQPECELIGFKTYPLHTIQTIK